MPRHRAFEQGQVEAVEILHHVVHGVVGNDIEASVDQAEHQVEVQEDGFAIAARGQAGGEVDRERGAPHAAGRPGHSDQLRAPYGGNRRIVARAKEPHDDLEQLGRFRGQREELVRSDRMTLSIECAVATGTRGQDDAVGAELRKAADQL